MPYKLVTWSPPLKAPSGKPYRVVGYINPPQPGGPGRDVGGPPDFGDLHVDTTYIDFQDVEGVKVPTRTARKQAGMETFVAIINGVRVNPADVAELVAGPAPPPPAPVPPAASEKLADGVYRITGGYVSLAVEFKDHVVVLEGGPSEASALAVIAETKRLFPANASITW